MPILYSRRCWGQRLDTLSQLQNPFPRAFAPKTPGLIGYGGKKIDCDVRGDHAISHEMAKKR